MIKVRANATATFRIFSSLFHNLLFRISDSESTPTEKELDDKLVATQQNPNSAEPDAPNPAGGDGPTIAKIEDVITLDPECDVLDLNHARIGKIEHLEEMVKLERLFMRWNLLKKIENLDTLTGLVELELYDNQITEIENLDALVNLE